MARSLISLLVAATLVAGAAVAEAAIPTGTYSGKIDNATGADGKITLTVKRVDGARRLVRLTWTGLIHTCEDDGDGDPSDDTFTTTKRTATGRVRLASDGTFSIEGSNPSDSVHFQVKGKFKSTGRVSGTIAEQRTYNRQDELDPDGAVDCKTGTVRYRAKRPS